MAHWRNSNFQIKHFIAGKCHTPDEAYRQLYELWEDRDIAVRNAEASALRAKAKLLAAKRVMDTPNADEVAKLEAEADVVEFKAFKDQSDAVLEQAVRERDYIKGLMGEVKPFCKYKDLPHHEAFQLAQEEEWLEELKWRAENFIASQGTIPHDHLATMRLHPAWEDKLLPYVNTVVTNMQQGKLTAPAHSSPLPVLENKNNLT